MAAYVLEPGRHGGEVNETERQVIEDAMLRLAQMVGGDLSERREALERLTEELQSASPPKRVPTEELPSASQPKRVRFSSPSRRVVRAAIAGTAAAALLVVGWLSFARPWWGDRLPMGGTAPTAPRERPFTARISADLPWAPLASMVGYPTGDYQRYFPPETIGYLTSAQVRGLPPDAPSASALGAVGAAQVLMSRVDRGVKTLRRVRRAIPGRRSC